MTTSTATQDACGCCEGMRLATPEPIYNRPGLDALTYRVGTHGEFLESMQARLSAMTVPELQDADDARDARPVRPLLKLTTRDASDASMALLDGFACVADVLTFYQGRIANEGYLRTATERRSVLELARLIGYALKPGVASTAYLAYTIDDNHPGDARIEPGAKSQSIPGPGEQPQTFETVEPLQARAKWNVLQPRLSQPQTLKSITAGRSLYLKGVATNLKPNDVLLVRDETANPKTNTIAIVKESTPEMGTDRTNVTLSSIATYTFEGTPIIATMDFAIEEGKIVAAYRERIAAAWQLAFDDAPPSQTAQVQVQILTEALARLNALPADARFTEADALVSQTMSDISVANMPANATATHAWRDALLQALTSTRGEAAAAMHQTRGSRAGESIDSNDDGESDLPLRERDELLTTVRGLSLPPSVPPRNAARLDRALTSFLNRRADGGLQVLNALRPDLSANLPVALTNVQAASSSTQAVYAFRAQAGVYGATAPSRVIQNGRGNVVGREDWPIDGTQELQVTLATTEGDVIEVKWKTQSGKNLTAAIPLKSQEETSITIGESAKIHVDSGDKLTSTGLEVTLTEGNFKQVVTFKRGTEGEGEGAPPVWVSVATNGKLDIKEKEMSDWLEQVVVDERSYELDKDWSSDQPHYIVRTKAPRPFDTGPATKIVPLDAPVDGIAPETFALVQRHGKDWTVATVTQSRTVSRNDYNFPAKITELTLDKDWLTAGDVYLADIRDTAVYARSELLETADEPVTDPICGDDQWIELDDLYSGLRPGRWLIVAGERADINNTGTAKRVEGLKSAELVMLDAVRHDVIKPEVTGVPKLPAKDVQGAEPLPGDSNHTYIKLARKLEYCYARDKVSIFANVVKATHGETRDESLGGGDSSQAFQTFALKQSPLTFVPSLIPARAETTLKVYVNGVRWREADSLALSAQADRHYVTKTDDDAHTTVIFGDGDHGARLPTGTENVRAIYRQGIGKPGNVQAEQVSLLVSRPLGVRAVVNPLRASGGADKENKDQARRNAPLAVLALDRLVSVKDYADFSRSFAGIGKSLAMRISDGSRQVVHVTIAGADDIPIDTTSDLYRNLLKALREFGDADVPVRLDMRELLLIAIQANVRAKADYLWETVVADIRRALYDALSFEQRELGQDVLLSEVISAIQGVRGVDYVDVDALGGIPEKIYDATSNTRRLLTPKEIADGVKNLLVAQGVVKSDHPDVPSNPPNVQQRIAVNLALRDGNGIRPAQLAVLSPAVPDLLVINQIP